FRANLQNATHFVGVAYPPNKISKTGLKMQAFSACFMKFCLALNSYKIRGSSLREKSRGGGFFSFCV
ncbi:MAG: hypothetical protein U0N03_09930, partial [Lachnospiraceae bacterium]